MKTLIQSILKFKVEGSNCLHALFGATKSYLEENHHFADSSIEMFTEIESLFIHLLQLAEQNNLDMDNIINYADDSGDSLFRLAATYSEKISLELISRKVKVNRIDNEFVTPSFKVQ